LNRIASLDFCRVLASISVIIFHYTINFSAPYYSYSEPFSELFKMLVPSVQLFFMLSGYLITKSLWNTKTIKNFYIKRFAKIYPTYILCILITFIIISILGLPGREASLLDLMSNFVFLNDFKRFNSVDGAYWSLIVEVKFYLIAGFLYFLSKEKFLKNFLLFASIGLFLFWGSRYIGFKSFAYFVNKFFICNQLAYFLVGIIAITIEKEKISHPIKIWCLSVILSSYLIIKWSFIQNIYLISSLVIFMTCLKFRNIKVPSIITWLASISYPLYLLHQNIGVSIIRYLKDYISNDYLKIVFTFFIMVTISWLIFKFFEDLLNRKIRKKFLN
jgi:peptidoglycan/LPS O-acetylase OafA/YrhL